MNKIGIMQGRICPTNVEILQLFPKENWQSEINIASEIGFSQFEILFDKELICLEIFKSTSNIEKLKIIEKKQNIEITSICIDYFSKYKTFSSSYKRKFFKILDKIFNFVKETSIQTIVIPYCDTNDIKNSNELMSVLTLLSLSDLEKYLEDNNLYLALELNLSALKIKECFDRFNFKNIGVCYDTGNATGIGFNAHEEILTLNCLIKHVHIKDKPLNGKNVMLGYGDADFNKCIKSLNKINYNNSLILETIYNKNPKKEARANFNFINNILSKK